MCRTKFYPYQPTKTTVNKHFLFCGKVIAEPSQEERGDGKMDEEVRKAIEKEKLKYVEGIRRGDAAAMVAFFTEDAILLPPNSEIIRGRKEIEEFLKCEVQFLKDTILTPLELSENGDTVHEVGKQTAKISQKGQKPLEVEFKYIVIYKHTASGWKGHRLIWNRNAPPKK